MVTKRAARKKLPLTAAVEEGPYYYTGSPERRQIADPGMPGENLVLEGRVLDRDGKPVPHAWLDFWQADSRGQYDNDGYLLRGHQYADKEGRYRLDTIKPRGYFSRAPHVHVKVRADEKAPLLTTQLFFPGEKTNASDPIFEERTVMDVQEVAGGLKALFDFVVETG